jgi:plasmid stability protein
MATLNKRTTVYLDPDLHKALRLKAATISRSVSELVNSAVREALSEDEEDISAFETRAREPLVSYHEMIKWLKKDGRI